MTQRIEPFFCFNMTHRIFVQKKNVSKKCTLFSVWLKQLNPLFEHVSMTWTLFVVTQRIEPFSWYDAENWTFLFTWLKDLSLVTWLKDFIIFFKAIIIMTFKNWTFLKNMTQRIAPFFFLLDSKNWTSFFCTTQRIEHFFSVTQRIEPFFFEYDSQNWTFFWMCLKELNLLFL